MKIIIKYPNQIYLLKGYHDTRYMNSMYGLYHKCMEIYNNMGIWYLINDSFDFFPIAAAIDRKIFCVHSGLSPKINFIRQINHLNRKKFDDNSPLQDLLCSYLYDGVTNFERERKEPSYLFGKN